MIITSMSLAKVTDGLKGTTRYLAYELLKEESSYTTQTDVWAFGMVLYVRNDEDVQE